MASTSKPVKEVDLMSLAFDLQVHWLTYLRAYDLGAVQQTCTFYSNPKLIDATVRRFQVLYDAKEVADGVDKKEQAREEEEPKQASLTFRELRFMEMRAVTRILQRPEPANGYFVSKSWCKQALKWLETQEEEVLAKKKLSKKKQRMQQRRLSDASPPWPDVNSDLLCPHDQMACSKTRSARRLDKQAWKILKKLYPDSTQLATQVGECVQCSLERETERKNQADLKEKQTKARKEPLQNYEIRQFYTRTRGIPTHMLREQDQEANETEGEERCRTSSITKASCPLQDGTYVLLPRAWCHGWRRLIRTGQGGCGPPHAGGILCEAHGVPLLPPHVDLWLQGQSHQLLESLTTSSPQPAPQGPPAVIPGLGPDEATIQALRAAGLTNAEVNLQIAAMLSIEQQQRPAIAILPPPAAAAPTSAVSKNELLDRENHVVVEILTLTEFTALEQLYVGNSFGVCFVVDNGRASFETSPCQKCDATGRQCNVTLRNRSLRNHRKSGAGTSSTSESNKQRQTGAPDVEY